MAYFKDVICIDLTKYNYEKLKEIAKSLNIKNFEALAENKKNGISKLWLDTKNSFVIIAYMVKGYKDLIITDEIKEELSKISPIEVIVKERLKPTINRDDFDNSEIGVNINFSTDEKKNMNLPVILDIDIILDKIQEYGLDSITKEEKKFLDNNK